MKTGFSCPIFGILLNIAGAAAVLLAACSGPVPSATPFAQTPTSPVSPVPTATRPPQFTATPSPTPVPLAARVNGEDILLEDFEQEVIRYELAQTSLGIDPASEEDYRTTVLEALIQQEVIEQAARTAGLNVTDGEVELEIEQVKEANGDEETFASWLSANLYSLEEFRAALKSQMLAARMTAHIAEEAPTTAEQVHARHILVASQSEAEAILNQLNEGGDFASLALANSLDSSSRAAGGDLGWFPRGLLTAPEVEAAAFNLQPEEISGVIHSALGYHIVQTLERDPERELSPDTRRLYQNRWVETWLQEQMELAQIERFVSP